LSESTGSLPVANHQVTPREERSKRRLEQILFIGDRVESSNSTSKRSNRKSSMSFSLARELLSREEKFAHWLQSQGRDSDSDESEEDDSRPFRESDSGMFGGRHTVKKRGSERALEDNESESDLEFDREWERVMKQYDTTDSDIAESNHESHCGSITTNNAVSESTLQSGSESEIEREIDCHLVTAVQCVTLAL
jgi:hypothetical protein